MGKKISGKVIDDTIKLKTNSVSSYDISRYLNVSDTWVDKIWQLHRCILIGNYEKIVESINKRYAGVETVTYLFNRIGEDIPDNVQEAIDRKSRKAKDVEESKTLFDSPACKEKQDDVDEVLRKMAFELQYLHNMIDRIATVVEMQLKVGLRG